MDDKAKKILARLQTQCAKREYCRSDVFSKALKALEGDRDAALEVVESLIGDRFVDDSRYASAFAREKASLSGWGPVKIRFALSGKGIGKEEIDDAIGEIDAQKARGSMEKALKTKWRTLEKDPDGKLRLLRFALSRGYEYETVRQAVDEICRG